MHRYVEFQQDHKHKIHKFKKGEVASLSSAVVNDLLKQGIVKEASSADYYAWKKMPQPKIEEQPIEQPIFKG